MAISTNDLAISYLDSSTRLIPFIEELRVPGHHVKLHDLNTLFKKSSLWTIPSKKGNGHKKFLHKVTGVIIEYQAHVRRKENIIQPNIQDQICDQLQKHLNILHNEIFRNGEEKPDYNNALANYTQWAQQQNNNKPLLNNVQWVKPKNNNKAKRK